MIWLLYLACGIAAAYQAMALLAVLRHATKREPPPLTKWPSVSVLKPVHGDDPFLEQAVTSHLHLDYPQYEMLCGINRLGDPAIPILQSINGAQIVTSTEDRPNAKVANLIGVAPHAKGEVIVVNDDDIRVSNDYLKRVVSPLADPSIGLVTCLYRPIPHGLPAAWETLGIVVDFAPSTLVAPLVGINEFGLGSTLCFRADDLHKIGGFEPVSHFLADDYQLAKRLTKGLGKRAYMSKLVVDTALQYRSWTGLWKHQVRWARTIRVSRGDGYMGLPVTHAGMWALVALLCGESTLAMAVAGVRIVTGFTAGFVVLRSPVALALPLIPLWDVWAFFIWMVGLAGTEIEWRGRRCGLSPDGRLLDPTK